LKFKNRPLIDQHATNLPTQYARFARGIQHKRPLGTASSSGLAQFCVVDATLPAGPKGRIFRDGTCCALTGWMSPLRSTETAATPESVELFWQHLATQTLEMTLYRSRLLALALGRRLFVKLSSAKFGQQPVFFSIVRLKRRMATSNGSLSFTRMIVIFQ
jgi:hypothetical protein